MYNLLTAPLITTLPRGSLTLPGVLAGLANNKIDGYPALRPHQGMFWHMFLVQLATIALQRDGSKDIPLDENTWCYLLRQMTRDYPEDEPWCLVVEDQNKPGFMQPAVPENTQFKNKVITPDSLDILITAKNHDLKQTIAINATPEDWIFALIALQTGSGYSGPKNYGIARMNGGSSSRAMLTLLPLVGDIQEPSHGSCNWFQREVIHLLSDYEPPEHLNYSTKDDIGLTWLSPWIEGEQLSTRQLNPMFIEVCRRVRILQENQRIYAIKGLSKTTRIDAKSFKGNIGDPWAPVHKTDGKSLTIGEDGVFNYRKMTEIMLSGNWCLPLLAQPMNSDTQNIQFILIAEAIGRGNSKTGGIKFRSLPISGRAVQSLLGLSQKETLNELAQEQMEDIKDFSKSLGEALVLAIGGGDRERVTKDTYNFVKPAQERLDGFADTLFFKTLWNRFESDDSETQKIIKRDFRIHLWKQTKEIFEDTLPLVPGNSILRPKAEVRARARLWYRVNKSFGDDLISEDINDAT